MRRRLPPLKTLPAFEIAADRLSFSEAAGELHLTHGAVSRQIKALETALGVPLFRRRNRRIELTEAGLALLPGVREALQLLEACTVQVATSPRQGALVVFCILVPAVVVLWGTPGSTADRWAWLINAQLSAMFLGAGYGAGAYFFWRTYRTERWHPSSAGVRVQYEGDAKPRVIDGPFTETKELIGGYWIIDVKSKEEAVEWASRVPRVQGDSFEIEVRQVQEMSDFSDDVQAAAAEVSVEPRQQPSAR